MAFKYFAPFHMKLATHPVMQPEEQKGARLELDKLLLRLSAKDQGAARRLIRENVFGSYWFNPEYKTPKALLRLAAVDIYSLYEAFSGPVHGAFSGQLLFNDDPTVHDINPRTHPRWSKKAVEASSRLLLEIGRSRDAWDGGLGHEAEHDQLRKRLSAMM